MTGHQSGGKAGKSENRQLSINIDNLQWLANALEEKRRAIERMIFNCGGQPGSQRQPVQRKRQRLQ